jgi:hypothetical protein
VDRYLGPMPPEQLVPLFATRHTVTVAEFETAQAAWTAFCSPDPTELVRCSARICPPCPFLSRALLRHLQQFPALRNSLSRAEQHIVALIDSGLHEFSELFPAAQKLEESIWMGDATFLQVPSRIGERTAAIVASSEQRFRKQILGQAGSERAIDRWLGGVHLYDRAPVWRWDEVTRTVGQ